MPIPRVIARLNRVGLNRVTRRIAPYAPGFGVVVNLGRKSGREFRTPVNVFPVEHGFLIALTYGADSDWVKNVLAAGECTVITRGREHHLSAPTVVRDPQREHIRRPEREILRLLKVEEFLSLADPL